MSKKLNSANDQIDLGELLAALWAHKILIIFITSVSIFFAGYKALTIEKRFTALAIFQIDEDNGSGFNVPGELGAIASLAGFSTTVGIANSEILLERVMGREFILDMNKRASLDRDKYFNSYNPENPDFKDPFWKAIIKKFIGWEKTKAEKNFIIERNIINNYLQNVNFDRTEGGAITISVTHADAKKAADYANTFMEEIRILTEDESITAQNLRLNYLSETLADALQDMEIAQENLKNYALKNSALAQENFISDSLKLDQIRMEKRKVAEITNLLSIIESLVKKEDVDNKSYELLRSNHPL